ncbi:MAG: beta-lactamase family protein [Bacteroidales bacterium]|nr:beta-lactamase family protein [Bacteroidales bacterium]
MKVLKVLRIILLFILVFFGEIAISFSDKASMEKVFPSEEKMPVSLRLTNNISAYESMQGLDQQIESFMKKWNIVGASVAVVKDERLLYSKGFGYADKDNEIKVEPKHLFRIASVSKLITAVAVMKLVEDNVISLNDTVFGENGILNDEDLLNIKDDKVLGITVKNLLNHTTGWTNRKGDPMFLNLSIARKMDKELPIDTRTIAQYVLQNRELDYSPGKKSVYSNFGYALTSLIIEKATDLSYEEYVVTQILNPLGIYDMHLGKSLPEDKYENEVKYYGLKGERNVLSSFGTGERVPKYYGGNSIETLGAAGGWVATPTELMKLLVAIDGFNIRQDLLSDKSIEEMTKSGRNIRPFGWTGTDSNGYWWRTGTLSGTSVLLKREKNGVSWVLVINTTPKYGARFPVQINKTMIRGLATIDNWPTYDLFDYYEPKSLHNKWLTINN